VATIFRVEKEQKAGGRQPPAFTLVSWSPDASTLKMEATCSSETSVGFQRTTLRYVSEDVTLRESLYGMT
jgi:hypothetical protein